MALLDEYRRKRKFRETPEPSGTVGRRQENRFVVQEHHARRLHYDFRLEVGGVLKSWAVPKGPSMNPADKRLAIQTEAHPLEYRTFEGTIPQGHYGAGEVAIWDHGTFEAEGSLPIAEQIERGEVKFVLHGRKLRGSFALVRLRRNQPKKEWLLIKHRDAAADTAIAPGRRAEPILQTLPGGKMVRAPARRPQRSAKMRELRMPEGAWPAPMPAKFQVALATLAENPPSDPGWLFEIKWDGVRALACMSDGELKLLSRANRDITREYPELAAIADSVNAREVCLDGEIVTLDSEGRSDFERLQNRMGIQDPPARLQRGIPVIYYAFDILYCDGHDLRRVPLVARKEFLKRVLHTGAILFYSDHQIGKGRELLALAAKRNLEGIVGKRMEGAYPSGRTMDWLKFKTGNETDAVVGGWTEPRGTREHFGALLLGLFEGSRLKFIGGVGSGFTAESQRRLWPQLQSLKAKDCAFENPPETREKASWVRPELVVRVQFHKWTEGRHLRQPVFLGLRTDCLARECTVEKELAPPQNQETTEPNNQGAPYDAGHEKSGQTRLSRPKKLPSENVEEELQHGKSEELLAEIDGRPLHLTHLNKIYFPEDGITKRNLLAYYYRMAPLMMPFLKDRPLVLRRYPNGIMEEAFFQKEADKNRPAWIKTVAMFSDSRAKQINYFVANDRATILYLTNLGCIDHNPWSSRAYDASHPDYIFFDLDPTEGTPFAMVTRVARMILEVLEKAGLAAFCKTSGATGFHVFVPVEPRYTYEQARAFVQTVSSLVDAGHPGLLTFERNVAKRARERVYVDAHQNSQGQSLASVYSVRAFPHAPVSTPVVAVELRGKLLPEKWNLKSHERRLHEKGDLWANFWKHRQRLEKAVEALDGLG